MCGGQENLCYMRVLFQFSYRSEVKRIQKHNRHICNRSIELTPFILVCCAGKPKVPRTAFIGRSFASSNSESVAGTIIVSAGSGTYRFLGPLGNQAAYVSCIAASQYLVCVSSSNPFSRSCLVSIDTNSSLFPLKVHVSLLPNLRLKSSLQASVPKKRMSSDHVIR